MPNGYYALHQSAHGYAAGSDTGFWRAFRKYVEADQPHPELIYAEVLPLTLPDIEGGFTLWVGEPDSAFWERPSVVALKSTEWMGYLITLAVVLASIGCKALVKRRRKTDILNQELERRVAERTAELDAARQAAELANRAKSDFLTNMSHELRTPMHAILFFSNLGEQRSSTHEVARAKLQQYFARIIQSATRLLHMLESLLDLSKLESGRAEYIKQRQDFLAIVQTVSSEFEALSSSKGVSLIQPTNAPGSGPASNYCESVQ